MFSKKDKDYSSAINQVTIIGKDAQFVGDLKTKDDIRIEGNITGSIISESRIIIGNEAHILGSVEGESIDVQGVVVGDIMSRTHIQIGAHAIVEGDIEAKDITIELGAKVHGYINAQGKNEGPFLKKKSHHELSKLSLGDKSIESNNHNNSSDLLDVISQKVYQNTSVSSNKKINRELEINDENNVAW
jgi:cytoskeletal protein CcmA (bactofilin family)